MTTRTTRPSSGLGSLRTRPDSSSLLISWVMAGWVDALAGGEQVSRCGPKRSTLASVAAAVIDSPLAGLSERNRPTIRSRSAASAAARASSVIAPAGLSIRHLYHMLM